MPLELWDVGLNCLNCTDLFYFMTSYVVNIEIVPFWDNYSVRGILCGLFSRIRWVFSRGLNWGQSTSNLSILEDFDLGAIDSHAFAFSEMKSKFIS